ncbi:MAG: hypothetical protein GEU71_18270, partial [Actinobacteria bacterium]|nr:hypothetical protein [Actinomycetota bacterium]
MTMRRIDSDEVPARLRRLASSSARRIPPPLLRQAVDALDSDDWLRSKVVEETDDLDPDAPAREHAASALFLLRPPSWEERIAELSERRRHADLAGELARMEEARHDDARTIERLRGELKRLERERDAIESSTAERFGAEIELEARRRLTADRVRAEVERRVEDTIAEKSAVEEALRASEGRLAETRLALERERRKPVEVSTTEALLGIPGSPEAIADTLDRVALAARRKVSTQVEPTVRHAIDDLAVRPDLPEAVTELLRTPRRWLIDGYNVAHLLSGRQPEAMDRLRLEAKLADLLTKAAS